MHTNPSLIAGLLACAVLLLGEPALLSAATPADSLGIFAAQADVGRGVTPGTAVFNAATNTYTLTSAGANTWYHVDDFHFLWKKVSGDMTLTADIGFPKPAYTQEPNPHRKGILMFRQTLDAGAAYVAVGAHGIGMTALQYRQERGANTQDIELNIDAPQTVRIEKRGDVFTLYLSMKGEPLHPVGASVSLHLTEPFYVGLGALSHDVDTTDKVEFRHVVLEPTAARPDSKPVLYSTLQTIQTEDQFRRAMLIRTVPTFMQSANWAPGGKSIYVQEDGRILNIPYLTPEAGGPPRTIAVAGLVDCSGNFGLSPDRHWLAVSCARTHGGTHEVYLVPPDGTGQPRQVTVNESPSFFHAWSPDSQSLAFTRGSAGKADIFTIALGGGAEKRLTRDTLNDGPDFSPDGQIIYFDSSRSGTTQIWRMHADGTLAEQITDDDAVNSSPHVSPDGKSLVFLSQPHGAGDGIGPAALKIVALGDGLIRTLVDFQGNRGSLSMYGWGDNNHLAFVSYQMLTPDHSATTK
jgi:TolB protein